METESLSFKRNFESQPQIFGNAKVGTLSNLQKLCMLGNYVQYFVMFTLSQAYDILSCDFLENAAAPASAGLRPASALGGLRPPGGRGALG